MKTLLLLLLIFAIVCDCRAQSITSRYDTVSYKHLVKQSKNYKTGGIALILFGTGIFCAGAASLEIIFQPNGYSSDKAFILMGIGSVMSLFSIPFIMHGNKLKRDARLMLTPGLSGFNAPRPSVGIGLSATLTVGRRDAAW